MQLVLISIGAIEKIIVLVVHSVEGTMLAVMAVGSNEKIAFILVTRWWLHSGCRLDRSSSNHSGGLSSSVGSCCGRCLLW